MRFWLKISFVLILLLFVLITAISSFLPDSIKKFAPVKTEIALGLDLKGGSQIVLEMDQRQLLDDRLEQIKDSIKASMRDRKLGLVRYTNVKTDESTITISARNKDGIESIKDRINSQQILEFKGWDIDIDGLDITYTIKDETIKKLTYDALVRTQDIVRRRIDSLGNKEVAIYQQGRKYIVVELPGVEDPKQIKDLIGKTAKLTFHLVVDKETSNPKEVIELPIQNFPDQTITVEKKFSMDGGSLNNAFMGFDARTNMPNIVMEFTSEGMRLFGDLTEENVGELFAIVMDGEVLSYPRISEAIYSKQANITGRFSEKEAQDLALLLKSGALPTSLDVVEENTIGAGLGAKSINRGIISILVGFTLVILLIALMYRRICWVVIVSLTFNISMILILLSIAGATLTLSGIAGIILTLGMAVDANILSFEMIRDKLRSGMHPIQASSEGFKRAWQTILDANITTIIPALILFQFGSGAVKGFAMTLILGILTTLFSNVFISKRLFMMWVNNLKLYHNSSEIPLK
ncbi:MAG: protein translocase subunit SecD [Alphaproteobacteria bacterium]|nr:protein translocase subunit SecD [Alphaproteobacteria bacterium]MBL0717935.1 protein translocase subunit SecD [Alphaproteobacteria bacterium]